MSTSSHAASTATCSGCGVSLPLDPGQAQVCCQYCGVVTALSVAWRQGAQVYGAQVNELQINELVARRLAALHAKGTQEVGTILRWTIVVALIVPWWIIAVSSEIAVKLPIWANVLWVGLLVGGMLRLAQAMTGSIGPPLLERMATLGAAQCNECGGFVAFAAGKAVSECQYCGAASLKPSTLANELLGSVAGKAVHAGVSAKAAQLRADDEVKNVGKIAGYGNASGSAWVVVCVVASCAITALVVWLLLAKTTVKSPIGWITPTVLTGIVVMVGWIVIGVRKSIRKNAEDSTRFGFDIIAATRKYNQRWIRR